MNGNNTLILALAFLVGCASSQSEQYTAQLSGDLLRRVETLEREMQKITIKQNELIEKQRFPSGVVAVLAEEQRPQNNLQNNELISAAPSTNQSLYQKAIAVYRAGDIENAIALFEQVLQHQENIEENIMAQYWLGDAYYNTRQFERASRYFANYLRHRPQGAKSAPALDKLVQCLRELGRNEDADILARQGAAAIAPNNQ